MTGQEELAFLEGGGTIRRLLNLSCSMDGQAETVLKTFTIAQWESHLLELREKLLGRNIEGQFSCPDCSKPVKIDFDIAELKQTLKKDDVNDETKFGDELRLETLLAIEDDALKGKGALVLILSNMLKTSKAQSAKLLDKNLSKKTLQRLESFVSGLNLELVANCFECEKNVKVLFDVAEFLEYELNHNANSILDQVHQIASRYNWSEHSILELPRARRLAYLSRIDAIALPATFEI